MADDPFVERLVRLEQQVEDLKRDVASLLALAAPRRIFAAAEPVVTGARVEPPAPIPPQAPAAPASPMLRAWRALERDDAAHALDEAFEAARLARKSGDAAALAEIAAFAIAASAVTDGGLRERADQLLSLVDATQAAAEPGLRRLRSYLMPAGLGWSRGSAIARSPGSAPS